MFNPALAFQVLIVLLIVLIILKLLLTRHLRPLTGHSKIVHLVMVLATLGGAVFVFDALELFQLLVGTLATAGVLAIILGFAIKDLWLSNALGGIALFLSSSINVGDNIQLQGQNGTIEEITLTTTHIRHPDGSLILVPNKKFTEEITVILKRPA